MKSKELTLSNVVTFGAGYVASPSGGTKENCSASVVRLSVLTTPAVMSVTNRNLQHNVKAMDVWHDVQLEHGMQLIIHRACLHEGRREHRLQ